MAGTDSPRGAVVGSWTVGRVAGAPWGGQGPQGPDTQHIQLLHDGFSHGSAYFLVWKMTESVCSVILGPLIQTED